MSRMRVTAAQILADCPMVVGFGGWGVLGSDLPSTGEHGPSVGYQWADLPADNDKEFWVRITTPPATGTLLMWPDSSFDYEGPGGTAYAQLYVEGQPVGTPQTVTVTVGAQISGTLSATESGADTLVASGVVVISGQLAATETGSDTAAIIGGNQNTGTLAAQESGKDTTVIAGTALISGLLSVSESGIDILAASGEVKVIGSLSASETGSDTSAILGGNILVGYMTGQEVGNDTSTVSGSVVVSGVLNASESGSDVFVANGSISPAVILGSIAAIESGTDSISVTGIVIVSGNFTVQEEGKDSAQITESIIIPDQHAPIKGLIIGSQVKVTKSIITYPVSASLVYSSNNENLVALSGSRSNPY